MREPDFAYANTKAQISFAVTVKLISDFAFTTQTVQALFFLKPEFQCSDLCVAAQAGCVAPGPNPRRPLFSRRGSYDVTVIKQIKSCDKYFKMTHVHALTLLPDSLTQ